MKTSRLLILIPMVLGVSLSSCGDTSTTSEEKLSRNTMTIVETTINTDTNTSDDNTSNETSLDTTSVDTTSSQDATLVTIYFVDQSWWNADAASTSIYYWGSAEETPAWPGIRMQWVSYDEVSGCNTWKFDIDTSLVTGFIFVRTHSDYQLETMPEGVDPNWGAQTVDITYKEDVNLYTLENTEPSWGGGESACTVIEGVYNG